MTAELSQLPVDDDPGGSAMAGFQGEATAVAMLLSECASPSQLTTQTLAATGQEQRPGLIKR
jgi:hypothetical protein